MASVDILDVRKAHESQQVIHGISVSITEGEFVILVGPHSAAHIKEHNKMETS